MTKAEYNRWLLRQENMRMADEQRETAKAGEELVKERQRSHTARGLARQQAAMVQMKRASESLEAHRQQNLTHGRKVYEEVGNWRTSARTERSQWAEYGKSISTAQKQADGAAASLKELEGLKKAQANTTRLEDQSKALEHEELKKARAREVKAAADVVRKETSDQVTDEAKRLFFEQRMKAATETKTSSAVFDKMRKENDGHFKQQQEKKRNAARAVRESAGKSRQELLSQRTENAKAVREHKMTLREQHKQRLQVEYLEKAATVKSVIENGIYREGEATGGSPFGSSPPGSPTKP